MQRRTVGLLLTGLGAALILIAVLSRTWFIARDGEETVRLGLIAGEECEVDRNRSGKVEECQEGALAVIFRKELEHRGRRSYDYDYDTRDYDNAPRDFGRPKTFVRLGQITHWGGIATGGALALLLLVVLSRPGQRAPRPVAVAVAVASAGVAVTAVLFVLLQPPLLVSLTLGTGLVTALFGAGCGAAGAMLLARYEPADEPGPSTGTSFAITPLMIAGVVGVALIVAAILTESWWKGSEHSWDVGFGVRTLEWCSHQGDDAWGGRGYGGDADCTELTLRQAADGEDRPRFFLAAGGLVFQLGLTSIALFGLGATLVLLRQPLPPWWSPARWASGTALAFAAASIAFVAARPKELDQVSLSYGPLLALLGAGALGGAGFLLARWQPAATAAPVTPASAPAQLAPVGSGPMAAPLSPAIPACPKCATPMLWVTAQGRWLCTVCKHAAS